MNEKIEALKSSFDSELKKIANMVDLEALRVNYLGRKGKVTDALKGMGGLTDEQKKTVGRETNELKTAITVALAEKLEALKAQELQREINALPEFDISMPPDMTRGSYHPITLVQRQCEQVFKSMGFTVEDYAEVVTDYECFESLNIPKFHPARDMQDTYYLDNGQLLKTPPSAAQTAKGITIPKAEVTLSQPDGVAADMLAFFIYQGRCYLQYDWLDHGSDLVGEKVGTATGLIDEWTPKEGYVELAGSVSGDFYTVNGFDPTFLLCMKEDGDAIQLFVCNSGITLYQGSELFEERLGLFNGLKAVTYEEEDSWFNG